MHLSNTHRKSPIYRFFFAEMNHNSASLFNFSSSYPRATARLSTSDPHHNLFNSPTNGWFVLSPSCDPELAHLFTPKIQTEPQRSLITETPKVLDLELRLGLPGQTSSEVPGTKKVSGTKMVLRTNRTTEVIPKHLMLTLGHKSYGKNYKKRARPSQTKGKVAQTKNTAARPSRVKRSKRDYYGPCKRCGRVFLTSPTYASHVNSHYRKDETAEEKKKRLSKKRKRVAQ